MVKTLPNNTLVNLSKSFSLAIISCMMFNSAAMAEEVILLCKEVDFMDSYSSQSGFSPNSFSVIVDNEEKLVSIESSCAKLKIDEWTDTKISVSCNHNGADESYNFWRLTGSFNHTSRNSDIRLGLIVWGKCQIAKPLF